MVKISKRAFLLAFAVALVGRSTSAGAISFQWDENPWPGPPGSTLTHTYNGIGNGSIDVTITDANGSLVTGGSPASPDSNDNLNPTGNAGEHSFFIRATGNDTSPFISIVFDQEITELWIQYRNAHTGGTNQWIGISNMSFSEVPEPEAFALMSLGLLGLAVAGRRPQRHRT